MKALVQRVSEASVRIDGKVNSHIAKGFVVLLGIDIKDTTEAVSYTYLDVYKRQFEGRL